MKPFMVNYQIDEKYKAESEIKISMASSIILQTSMKRQ